VDAVAVEVDGFVLSAVHAAYMSTPANNESPQLVKRVRVVRGENAKSTFTFSSV